jgi:hypothetical protein
MHSHFSLSDVLKIVIFPVFYSKKCNLPKKTLQRRMVKSLLYKIYMFVVSGHLSIGLPTLSPPATLYLGITIEAGKGLNVLTNTPLGFLRSWVEHHPQSSEV